MRNTNLQFTLIYKSLEVTHVLNSNYFHIDCLARNLEQPDWKMPRSYSRPQKIITTVKCMPVVIKVAKGLEEDFFMQLSW